MGIPIYVTFSHKLKCFMFIHLYFTDIFETINLLESVYQNTTLPNFWLLNFITWYYQIKA